MDDFEKIVLRCIIYYNSQRVVENFPYTEEMLKDGIQPYATSIFQWGVEHLKSDLISVPREAGTDPASKNSWTVYPVRIKGERDTIYRKVHRTVLKAGSIVAITLRISAVYGWSETGNMRNSA